MRRTVECPCLSVRCGTLTHLLRKDSPFIWGLSEQEAVDKLRESLCQPPVLSLPNFGKSFILYPDASDGALGAVLAQEYEGQKQPVAFVPRALTAQEPNFPVRDKEFLSGVWAVSHLHSYLRFAPFVRTDLHFLILLRSTELPEDNARVRGWLGYLQGYAFDVQYELGSRKQSRGALSRIPYHSQT